MSPFGFGHEIAQAIFSNKCRDVLFLLELVILLPAAFAKSLLHAIETERNERQIRALQRTK
jgi:hypothetical protein